MDKNNVQDKEGGNSKHYNRMLALGWAEGVAQKLKTNLQNGIDGSDADIADRKRVFGSNENKPHEQTTCCRLLIEPLDDTIVKVLMFACVIQLVIGYMQHGAAGLIDGISILVAIIIITVVTAGNNYMSEKKFRELAQEEDNASCVVFRGGKQITISIEELVVGDILKIQSGCKIPVDGLLFECNEVKCDESALTGEPDEIAKQVAMEQNLEANPIVLRGSMAKSGEGTCIVCGVGSHTMDGRASEIVKMKQRTNTPLQDKLETIANYIGYVGMAAAGLTFVAMILRTIINVYCIEPDTVKKGGVIGESVLDAFIIAVTVIVVAIPEGLPLAVTISLSYSVKQMFKEKNLVRELAGCETMGGADQICTDKTGTLTQNIMTVQAIHYEGQEFRGDSKKDLMETKNGRLFAECIAFNATAFIQRDEQRQVSFEGNPSEQGLMKFIFHSGAPVEEMLEQKKGKQPFVIPFTSDRKRAASSMQQDGSVRVFCKGASEKVLALCTNIIGADGDVQELDDDTRQQMLNKIEQFAKQSFRTFILASKDVDQGDWDEMFEEKDGALALKEGLDLEEELTCVALVGIADPLRPEVRDAIAQCHRSGVNVRMCTGDNIVTAKAISLDAGIITQEMLDAHDNEGEESYVCMEGPHFAELVGELEQEKDDEGKVINETIKNTRKFEKIAKQLQVMARCRPNDKYVLATGLQQLGHVVAMTGDGQNDAPALSKADIGFAMGICGSDAAKNASDIVIMDDNFASVIVAIKFGRNVYDCVRKFLQFQMTVNVVAMFIVFSGAVIFTEPPLNSVQMLWVNLIMDTFAALALATEPPSPELLNRQPHKRDSMIVSPVMWRNIFGQAFYQIFVMLLILFCGAKWFGFVYPDDTPLIYTKAWCDVNKDAVEGECVDNKMSQKAELYTVVFQTFVFMQCFNQINSRKLGDDDYNVFAGFFNNWMFLFITILTFAIQILMVQYAGRGMTVVALDWTEQAVCFGFGAFSIIWGLIIKVILPSRWFACLSFNETPMSSEEKSQRWGSSLKKSRSQKLEARKMLQDAQAGNKEQLNKEMGKEIGKMLMKAKQQKVENKD